MSDQAECLTPYPSKGDLRKCGECGTPIGFRDRIVHMTQEEADADRRRYAETVRSLRQRIQEGIRKARLERP